jgi:hypothetical protein
VYIYIVSGVRQLEIHSAELLVPYASLFEAEIAITDFKRFKSSGRDQIPAELIQAGGETLLSEIYKLIQFIWNKEELPCQWNESIIVPIYKKCNKIDWSNYHGISLLPT